jgi:hypothetical protein
MTTDTATLTASLAGYARRLHAVAGDQHHVLSPLGAWLLVALAAPAADGRDREELTQVLGCDVPDAARIAADLLTAGHPAVASAAGAWTRDGTPLSAGYSRWQAGLPAAVSTGALPGQAALDEWSREHTFDLIDRFPLDIDDDTYLVLATALATKVSWDVPFELAPARELGPESLWAGRLTTVLRAPSGRGVGNRHRQFIAVTPEAGDVAVHVATAGTLLVASVAAAQSVPAGDVLAAAQRVAIACAAQRGPGDPVPRRALADLPLGEAPLWRIREEQASDGGGADKFTAVLPAWTARTRLGLGDPSLGFGAAAHALAGPDPWDAAQAAMARFSRTGFEAAAVTGLAVALALMAPRPARRRVADLRFAHPYAAVAVALDDAAARRGRPGDPPGPWHGVPVFSAWVADPEDAGQDSDDSGRDAAR